MDGSLHQESIAIERVVVELDASDVAEDFEHKAEEHSDHETPCFVENTQTQVRYYQDGEEDDEEEIGAVGGEVEEG